MSALTFIDQIIEVVSLQREIAISQQLTPSDATMQLALSTHEILIINSLEAIVPSAARSYLQGIRDLADPYRISYRGAANEFRETLRELVDHLAPDDDVCSQHGFQLERDQTKPTRKQKVRYILKAREMSDASIRVPEGFIDAIEEKVAAVVSAAYSRSANASHVHTERLEVQRIKQYLDPLISEIIALKIPNSPLPKNVKLSQ